jgi:hypothetical protein
MPTIINRSSTTVYVERDGKSQAISPGQTADSTLDWLVGGEIFLRAESREVDAQYFGVGRYIETVIFTDRSAIPVAAGDDTPTDEDPLDPWRPDE